MKKVSLAFMFSIFIVFIMGATVGVEETNSSNLNINKMQATKAPNIFYDKENKSYYNTEAEGYIEVFKVEGGKLLKRLTWMNILIDKQLTQT